MTLSIKPALALCASLLLTLSMLAHATPDSKCTLLDATHATGAVLTPDSAAIGGKVAIASGSYRELGVFDVPDGDGPWTIWVRYRGSAIQLKSVAASGKRSDLNWLWAKPSRLTWTSFGKHAAAELGSRISIMRGPEDGGVCAVDAIVFARDDAFDPGKAYPDFKNAAPASKAVVAASTGTPIVPAPSDTTPIFARVSISWSTKVGNATKFLYGTNDNQIGNPRIDAQDPMVDRNLDDFGISFLRLHSGGLTDAWSDAAKQDWDRQKIAASLAAPHLKGRAIIMNIPHWPRWLKTEQDGTLAPSEYDAMASFCANLVRIVNGDLQMGVRYWEPQNEWDMTYERAGKRAELWTIFSACARAMKQADPTIQVGGIALCWDDPVKIAEFVKQCGADVDFITFHRYGSGAATDSTDKLMASAANFGERMKTYPALVRRASGGRTIPLMLDEYGLDFSWDSGETRQWTNAGAVWYAAMLRSIAYAGMGYALNWDLKDHVYGLTGMDDRPRPMAQVLRWGNRYLTGDLFDAKSSLPRVAAMAVRQADGDRSILLINEAAGPATITLKHGVKLAQTQKLFTERLDENGAQHGSLTGYALGHPINLPPYSLLLIRLPKG